MTSPKDVEADRRCLIRLVHSSNPERRRSYPDDEMVNLLRGIRRRKPEAAHLDEDNGAPDAA